MTSNLTTLPPRASALVDSDRLTELCECLFESLSRTDQRRWGEMYVRGLVSVPGRKSIRHISDHVVGGGAEQSLQQFVNQSPWDWEPVQRRLAEYLCAEIRPRAWVVEEVVFPKNGGSSVGVERQYSHSAGRTLNCQLALAVFLIGEFGGCPVNWRLVLPPSWDRDDTRRNRSYIPDGVRHRSRWDLVLDCLAEMIDRWHLPAAPVVLDARQDRDHEPLLSVLEQRGYSYLLQVSENATVGRTAPTAGPQTAADVITRSVGPGMTLRAPYSSGKAMARTFFVTAPVYDPGAGRRIGHGKVYQPQRHLLAESAGASRRPRSLWLTNLHASQLAEAPELVRARRRVAADIPRLCDDRGLHHFEGRSYRGWHHHVTLTSIAHAHHLLNRLTDGPSLLREMLPYA